jgi:hypothetical protein
MSNAANKPFPAEFNVLAPASRGIAPRLWQLAALACGLIILLASVLAGRACRWDISYPNYRPTSPTCE